MKISERNNTTIKELNIGDTFMYSGNLHIKIYPSRDFFTDLDRYPNAVLNLKDNMVNQLGDEVKVTKVLAEIIM